MCVCVNVCACVQYQSIGCVICHLQFTNTFSSASLSIKLMNRLNAYSYTQFLVTKLYLYSDLFMEYES